MDELDTSPGVVRDTERDLDDVKHGVHPTGLHLASWSDMEQCPDDAFVVNCKGPPDAHVIRCIYFNTSQIKSVYALLEETRSFSSS
jgi:hypothetical protein